MSEVRSGQLRVVTKLSCIGDGVFSLDENKEFFMVGVGTPYLVLDRVVGPTGINTSWRILLRDKVTSWREADILCDTLLEEP